MVDLTDRGPPPSDDIGRKRETPMNSTPGPKETEPDDALIARADERLVHAYEQIKRADEELARVSEQLAKMERDAAHPPSAGPGPQPAPTQLPPTQSPPRRPALRILVGLPLAACIVVAALVLQSSYGGGAKLVVARWAPQLVSTPSLPPENPPIPAQPAPSIVQVAAAEAAPPQATPPQATSPGSGRTARRRADGYRNASRSDAVAANDSARSRESGAKHRTAQGEPAANGQRQFKSHWGAQGEPGRDKARAREGFRAEPAQDVTASDAAGSDLAQARADTAGESAAPIPKGVDLRRLVAVDSVIIEILSCNNARRERRTVGLRRCRRRL